MRRSRVLTIPPGVAFLDILADALLDGALVEGYAPRGDSASLAAATIYLPTRRAVRAFREVLLDRSGGEAVLLPRILALGEVDEDEAAFEIDAADEPLPPAAAGIERQIGLTRLILGWSRSVRGALLPLDGEDEPLMIPSSPGDAAALATSLAGFIDGLEIDRVPGAAIGRLAAEHQGRYDKYWDLTATFLSIATALWPEHLAAIGRLDPVERRNRLIAAETTRIAAGRRPDPVIVAGSTGSVPATRDLIAAVAGTPLAPWCCRGSTFAWTKPAGAPSVARRAIPRPASPPSSRRSASNARISPRSAAPRRSGRTEPISCPKRCARPPPPSCGPVARGCRRAASPRRSAASPSSRRRTKRRKRSPRRWRCARRSTIRRDASPS